MLGGRFLRLCPRVGRTPMAASAESGGWGQAGQCCRVWGMRLAGTGVPVMKGMGLVRKAGWDGAGP